MVRFHGQVGTSELGDIRQLLVDVRGLQVGQVQQHVVLVGATAAALAHLVCHGSCHDIAGCEVLNGRCVALHEALTVSVTENTALTASTLGHEDAQACQAGRVELNELHVLQGQAGAQCDGHAVTGEGVGVGSGLEDLAATAGCEDYGLGLEDVHLAGCQVIGDNAGGTGLTLFVLDQNQVEHVELVVELNVVTHAVLVQGLQNHVAGTVSCVACAAHGSLTVVAGVATEAALVDAALGGSVEGKTHLLQVEHGVDGFLSHNFCRVLIDQVIATLDGVKGVPLPVVLLDVGQSGTHTALRRTGVGTGRVKLGQNRGADSLACLNSGTHTGTAGADDHYIVLMYLHDVLSVFSMFEFVCRLRRR